MTTKKKVPTKAKKTTKKKVPAKAKKTTKKKVPAKAKKKSILDKIAERVTANKKELERAKDKSEKNGRALFKLAVAEIFKEFKDLRSFQWDEYTPHWNDGDECVFSCHFDSLSINDENEDEDQFYVLEHAHKLLSNREREEARIVKELAARGNDPWKVQNLENDLKILREKDPEEVAKKYRIKKTIIEILEKIDESVYRNMFGEGTVIVSRDGIEVEECEHD